ncbi:hypothetical protein LTR10_019115 [Elasticomyces elasticus]|uniref:AB hydrolase-1 domain-containing protein n=1 Tax=Exophiala sideris TaxID=1016849 RepID=A0ABR0JIQ0_9EURO|nr:hypothetical protein LTR10_019115 [Elasticomyces elasticus]KAK5033477.1 hypothetical protein LTS07_003781 [Exophiala sideris]KAK5042028.1 hypothetical protein LTR13_001834 [Exophiala sideris]KAK5064021.1 hypothetical protein LTR69_003789 [Exophiala sideris]KAK5185296.1 hypothetical protein LTR44_002285 [Eurotiomycetes sp. CCFEE 6388]
MSPSAATIPAETEAAPQYTELPERAQKAVDNFIPPEALVEERARHFESVQPRSADQEGDTEVLDGVEFTHHFVDAPGDHEFVRFHYVEAGTDSWYQWHHQMAALSKNYRCIAPDLKGYGQSEKKPGDYRHQGAAENLYAMLEKIGVVATKFNVITHDRGTVQADYIVAKHPEAVLRYGRGEQHLYHFNPVLAPQGDIFRDAPYTGIMEDTKRFVVWVYTWIAKRPIPDEEFTRTIQEYSYPGITRAVPRYFNSSTFRAEWLDRRNRLLRAWKCPVMIMQGYESRTQPREFYEAARDYIPNAKEVRVKYMPGGHFWTMESPKETTEAIQELLAIPI